MEVSIMAVSTTAAVMLSPDNQNVGGVHSTRSEEQGVDLRLVIQKQARALEESCEKGALRDTLIAARWHNTNLCLGISSTIIAAVAAFSRGQFGEWEHLIGAVKITGGEIAAALALISAVLTSILTFLSPSEKAGSYHHFSNKLRSLRDRVRAFTQIDCSRSGKEAALCEKFDRMVREKSEIDSSHPIVPNWAYGKARKRRREEQNERSRYSGDGNVTASA
jgi:hypothetical protein